MNDDRSQPSNPDATDPNRGIEAPPQHFAGIVRRLGPGLIIAGSIVGSGELIGTTKTGAEAGFWLLWLIIVGCVIKVFTQVEFGRFAIAEGRTSMEGMNEVPGPRLRVNWLMWYWVLMFTLGLGQLGGIVGSVGQALAITIPITHDIRDVFEVHRDQTNWDRTLDERLRELRVDPTDNPNDPPADSQVEAKLRAELTSELGVRPELPASLAYTHDDVYWGAVVTIITAALLVNGRYSLIQYVATTLVASFTAVTVFNVLALQTKPEWAIGWNDLLIGMSFRLPPAKNASAALGTALATFGIIGVGAAELIAYPYWCLEKGYARSTGPRSNDSAWAERARGWLRVMRWDAWCSMLIYTFATVAFYFQGAAILNRAGLNPSKSHMLFTLTEMYVPVFGNLAGPIFLCGAFAVLFSTFFVANAGNARMASDALCIFRLIDPSQANRQKWVRIASGVFPFVSLAIYCVIKDPVQLVLVSGLTQSIMLPMLGAAGLYFRYRRCDPRIRPSRLWDLFLWISVAGLLLAGVWGVFTSLPNLLAEWTGGSH